MLFNSVNMVSKHGYCMACERAVCAALQGGCHMPNNIHPFSEPQTSLSENDVIEAILSRHSVSPKRVAKPGPTTEQLRTLMAALPLHRITASYGLGGSLNFLNPAAVPLRMFFRRRCWNVCQMPIPKPCRGPVKRPAVRRCCWVWFCK